MFGCYMTSDDEKFLDSITEDLDKYKLLNDPSFILIFPPLPSRHRLLIHRLRDKNYSDLFSFSTGEDRNTRRIIICFKSQLMDETTITSTENNASDSPKIVPSSTIDPSNNESMAKRRPDQVLYKPPRRSKNSEVSSPVPAPSPPPPPPTTAATTTTSVEDVQQTNSNIKPTKSKTARPSVEPYVPPSRRNQTLNKEPPPSAIPIASSTNTDKKEDGDQGAEEEEEEWEKLLDSNDNLVRNDPVDEIQKKFKENLQIKKPTNDYSQWSTDDIQTKEADLAHVVEVSNFPATFRTEDLATAFRSLTRSPFDIKWVDETHALVIFPDPNTALDALQMEHPMFKICSMSQASSASKKKARNTLEFLQPYKARPQTTSLTANRAICAALGLKNPMNSDKAKTEREKIELARQQKRRDKEEQKTVWDGGVLPAASTT